MNEELRKALVHINDALENLISLAVPHFSDSVQELALKEARKARDTLKALLERPQAEAVARTTNMPAQAKVPEWLPVEVENPVLPDEGQEVLVMDRSYGIRMDKFDTWSEQPAGPLVGGHVTFGPWFTENDDVTHWMPLPAAPEPPAVAEGKGPEVILIGDSLMPESLYVDSSVGHSVSDGLAAYGINDPTVPLPAYFGPMVNSHWCVIAGGHTVVRILKDGTVDIKADATPEQLRTAIEIMAGRWRPAAPAVSAENAHG